MAGTYDIGDALGMAMGMLIAGYTAIELVSEICTGR